MIKTLRFKFIKIAMLSISLVLIVIIGSINLANYLNLSQNINTKLELILSNGGTFPNFNSPFWDREPGTKPFLPPIKPDNDILPNLHDGFQRRGISAESPFDTRYFTVTMDSNGTIKTTDTGKIAAVSTETATTYASLLFAQNRTGGYIDCYKFIRQTTTKENGDTTILYVFLDCERELTALRSFLLASLGISLAGLFVFFLLVFFFSRHMVGPIAESYEKQKRFITDASHEIKTPLTIIDANTEVLEMTGGENEWTKSTRKQIQRLASLTEKLVFLSRLDEENIKPEFMDFSLSDAVLDIADSFCSVASAHGKIFETRIESGIMYHGNEGNIRQMVSLLLDNAMKYSSPNGTVRLTLCTNGRSRTLTVWNTVDSIETGKLDCLFDRFYRADASRSSETGGFGIGLSVVQAIVNSHKGQIKAQSADGKSILFTISL